MRRTSPGSAVRTALLRASVPIVVAAHRVTGRVTDRVSGRESRHDDRGDVPGWVLVTLMTAGLVTALWVLARDRLTHVFDTAITSVTG
jgi:hypothetical protein